MNEILDQIDEQIQHYSTDNFTNLDGEWKALVGWNNYYRWLWAAVSVLKPKCLVEIGRERGVSATIMLDAMESDARLMSIDIVEESVFLKDLQDNRLTQITGDSTSMQVIANLPKGIDFLFVDGEHTGEKVTEEWGLYKQALANKAVVVFDDIHFDDGMTKFWDSITEEKYDITKWHERGFGVVFM